MPSLSGSKNPAWKGGRIVTSNGYIKLHVGRKHHLADKQGYAYEHRIVAEKKLGRKLRAGEVAHHIDGNRKNNEPSNIEVIDSHRKHLRDRHPLDRHKAITMQAAGAKTKHQRTIDETLPAVLTGIKQLIDSGVKPTQRACAKIAGYYSVQRWYPQAQLVKMAKDL